MGLITVPVFAEKTENLVPANNSTFESGEIDWSVLKGGTLSVANNPDGSGKALKFSDIPEFSYASPWINIRPYIQSGVKKPAVIYGSFDAYSVGTDSSFMIRLRTDSANGFSMCKTAGKNYCDIALKVTANADQWTKITFQLDVTADDLKSAEKWNICFDGI